VEWTAAGPVREGEKELEATAELEVGLELAEKGDGVGPGRRAGRRLSTTDREHGFAEIRSAMDYAMGQAAETRWKTRWSGVETRRGMSSHRWAWIFGARISSAGPTHRLREENSHD